MRTEWPQSTSRAETQSIITTRPSRFRCSREGDSKRPISREIRKASSRTFIRVETWAAQDLLPLLTLGQTPSLPARTSREAQLSKSSLLNNRMPILSRNRVKMTLFCVVLGSLRRYRNTIIPILAKFRTHNLRVIQIMQDPSRVSSTQDKVVVLTW